MTDIEKVVLASKRLEGMLKRHYGSKGKGLHELTNDQASRLPDTVVKQLHFVATLRNKIIHEEGFDHLDDPKSFDRVVKELEKNLEKGVEGGAGRGCSPWIWRVLLALLGLVLGGLIAFGR